MTQYDKLAKLLTRKRGATAMEIVEGVGTVAPHRRLADLREKGWAITRRQIEGRNFGAYFGTPPKKAA